MSEEVREEYQDRYKPLLDKLFNQVYKNLKKRMFPRRHRKLLRREVEIDNMILNPPTIGRYASIEKSKYDYTHKIIIDSKIILDYLIAGDGWKLYYKNQIKDTMAHEIIHAYVKENYWYIDKTSFYDGSPVYLSILTFLNIKSGHAAMKSFTRTKLYKRVKQCTDFENLECMLLEELYNYEDKFEELKEIMDNGRVLLNDFEFSNGKVTGVKGLRTLTLKNDKIVGKANLFEIGPYTEVDCIKNLVLKKINNNSFEEKIFSADKKQAIRVQHMNI